jgi:hypothetical protein
MSAAGESTLCIVIATRAGGQRIAASDDVLVEATPKRLAGRACSRLGAARPVPLGRSNAGHQGAGVRAILGAPGQLN